MNLESFVINEHIQIIEDNITYTSIIQGRDDSSITINIPYYGNRYYPLHMNKKINFLFPIEACILKYSGIVTEIKCEGNLQLFRICNICFIEKIQRRNYYRHPMALPVKYYIIPKHLYSLNKTQLVAALSSDMILSVAKDISGGGLCLILKKACDINDRLLISYTIENELIYTLCSPTRLWKDNETGNYIAGLSYTDIDETTRDKIIKFIFGKLIASKRLFI